MEIKDRYTKEFELHTKDIYDDIMKLSGFDDAIK